MKNETILRLLRIVREKLHEEIDKINQEFDEFMSEEYIGSPEDMDYSERYEAICNKYKPLITELSNELGLDD